MYIPCLICGETEDKIITTDYLNGLVCEYEIVCAKCGGFLNYWSYGQYSEPRTIKELMSWRTYRIRERIEILLKTFYWIFRRRVCMYLKKLRKRTMICPICGRDIDAIGQDNMSYIPGSPLCEDCARWMEEGG